MEQVIVGYLTRHRHKLTKLSIEGVKIANQEKFVNTLKKMPVLFEFKVTEISNPEFNEIARKSQITRKTMAILQRVYKRSLQHRCNY